MRGAIYFDIFGTMKSINAVESLAALAQESRLAIFRLLVKRGPEGYTPSQLGEKLDVASATLSFHLKELQRAGLIDAHAHALGHIGRDALADGGPQPTGAGIEGIVEIEEEHVWH